MNESSTSIAIIGAGITGLTAGYMLHKKGYSVSIYESRSESGGAIRTASNSGWLLESGPNTLMLRDENTWTFLKELRLDDELIYANEEATKRYIVKNRSPVAIPMSFTGFLTTGLLSPLAKFRLLKEPFVPAYDDDTETVAHFFERRLGPEVVNYLVDPFIAGIYAGEPEHLSMRHAFPKLYSMEQEHGSLLRGIIKKKKHNPGSESFRKGLVSFSDGLQTLPRHLASLLEEQVTFNRTVHAISRENNSWKVQFKGDDEPVTHDALILTIPAHTYSDLTVPDTLARSFNMLSQIPYSPVSVLSFGFQSSQIDHPLDGFGMLVPKKEPFRILGTLFSSTLFPGRAPKNHSLLTTFLGGSRHPGLVQLSSDKQRQLVLDDLDELLGISGDPVFEDRYTWQQAIPQYTAGFRKYLDEFERVENEYPGLFLRGNFRNGISLPDRITDGIETAENTALFLHS